MKPLFVASIAELPERISSGQSFVVDVFPGSDVEDIELTDEMFAAELAILDEINRRVAVVQPGPKPEPKPVKRDQLDVSFTSTHVEVVSPVDLTVVWGGDVRDGRSNLTAGKPAQRKLSRNAETVTVNGVEYVV